MAEHISPHNYSDECLCRICFNRVVFVFVQLDGVPYVRKLITSDSDNDDSTSDDYDSDDVPELVRQMVFMENVD